MAEAPRDLDRQLVGSLSGRPDLTVLQWNVLADWATKTAQKSGTASEACLAWPSRLPRILGLLADGLEQMPDVICMQEVDHYQDVAGPLELQGYRSVFQPKGGGRDGCAVFVCRERFDTERVQPLSYKDPGGGEWSQVALLVDLRAREGGQRLQVATTHLKAKPGHEAIRCEQVRQLLSAVASDRQVIVAGDFNDVPDSDACELMRERQLEDAYRAVTGSVAPWTTWKYQLGEEKRRTIDYVWHTPGDLRPMAVLGIPSDDEIEPSRLPSWQYPSDHLSLVVAFEQSDR